MAITVKKTALWRKELDNQPGTLAAALAPLAEARADLQLVMLYRFPGTPQGAIEVHPVSGKKVTTVARRTGLAPSSIPVLLVEGDNRAGLGYVLAKAVGDSGINVSFLMAQVVGRRYTAVFGFENAADATKAATLIKKAAEPVERELGSATRLELKPIRRYLGSCGLMSQRIAIQDSLIGHRASRPQ